MAETTVTSQVRAQNSFGSLLSGAAWCGIILLGLVVAAELAFFALHAAHLLSYPYPLDYGEGPLLAQVDLLRAGTPVWRLYGDPGAPPYAVVNYPPVYHLLAALAATLVDHQAYPDKFFLMPFMAISAAWLAVHAASFAPARALSAATTCSFALFLALLVVRGFRDYPVRVDALGRQRTLAANVAQLARRHSSVWAVGCLHLLAFEHLQNHTPIGVLIDDRVVRYAKALYPELRPAPMPRVVLVARVERQVRPAWLGAEYRERTTKAFAREGVSVWIRKGDWE